MYPFVKKDTVTQYLFCHPLKGHNKTELYPFVKNGTVTQYLFCHSLKGMTKQALCFATLLRKESFLNLIELPS